MRSLAEVEKLVKRFRIKPTVKMNERTLPDALKAQEEVKKTELAVIQPNIWRIIVGSRAGSLAAAFLIISSLIACFVLSRKNVNLKDELELARRDIATTSIDDSVTINFYLREHQDFIARQASLNSVTPQPEQIRVSQNDILYYELFNDETEYMYPGIIVRGPTYRHQTDSTESPAISNGHILTLSESRKTADFDLVSPSWLHPYYALEQIRRIEGRDALHLLYTDGINTVSLFEQPLEGQRGLAPQDFREYAVYRNKEQAGGTILAWRDDALSYVLIGNIEMSQLMDMAQSISAAK